MIWNLGHPPFERLSRFVDDELDDARRTRVAAHLATCERCRDTIRFIHELGEAARDLPVPEPPADVVDRFLARRAAGERVILPTSDPVPLEPEPRRTLPAAIAATVALFIAGTFLISVPRLNADRSRLSFAPERPQAGAHVDVEYESGAQFRSETSLVLRGRFRYQNGKNEVVDIGRLTRHDDGTFRGNFTLPDSVVYAVFAVEDTAAGHVDSNTRRYWELLVHDHTGRPLLAALRERVNDHFGRNWELAYQTAREMTELYPDMAESWYMRYSFEASLYGGAARDSVIHVHRSKFRTFEREYADGPASADELAAMILYALTLGDAEAAESWNQRLLTTAPEHPIALQVEAANLLVAYRDTPRVLLAALEELWMTRGHGDRAVAATGFRAAMASQDSASILTWADRYAEADPEQAISITVVLTEDARLRSAGIQRLQHRLEHLESTLPRRLSANSARHRFHLDRELASLRTALGEALIASGAEGEGLAVLAEAAETTWSPEIFRTVANAFTAAGDTLAALPYLARWAVDPSTPPTVADSLAELGARSIGWDAWFAARRDARANLVNSVILQAIRKPLVGNIRLRAPDGVLRDLDSVLDGRPAVIALWSCMCAPAIEASREFGSIARHLEANGVQVFVIATPSLSGEALPGPDQVLAEIPTYIDVSGRAADAFGQWTLFQMFVVDANGFIRFDETSSNDILRKAVALTLPEEAIEVVSP